LALGGLAQDAEDGEARIARALENGRAAELFGEMVAALGGPVDFVERWPDRLPAAPVVREVAADSEGFVATIDGEALGLAVVDLGGGRHREGDRINPSVGLAEIAGIGEHVSPELPLALIHAATETAADAAEAAVRAAFTLTEAPVDDPPLIWERIG
jgi:thymidine phosphorylase